MYYGFITLKYSLWSKAVFYPYNVGVIDSGWRRLIYQNICEGKALKGEFSQSLKLFKVYTKIEKTHYLIFLKIKIFQKLNFIIICNKVIISK